MGQYDQYFREMCIWFGMLLIAFVVFGCGPAIRDSETYSAEVDFVEAASSEQVERGIALINVSCKCEFTMGLMGFTTAECQELAQTIVVVKYRMRYHTAFMRFLGGISEDRPPEEPPAVPDAAVLCPYTIEPIADADEIYGDTGADDESGGN